MPRKFITDGAGTFEEYCSALGIEPVPEKLSKKDLALLIDHTLLKPEASTAEVKKLCAEAAEYGFKSVCVNPYMVPYAGEYLRGSGVLVCTVIGFPLGAGSSAVKAFETEDAVRSGADEIDMVINIGALKEKDYKTVKRDISEVAGASGGKLVKVIFETCLLTDDEIKTASNISMEAGANYVKTSTGFSTGGATESAIKIMRGTVGSELGVKASGGVRDSAGFYAMLKAGATRIGASAGVAIVTGQSAPEGKY